MFVSDALQVNDAGHLTIGGADVLEAAKQYGTPLFLLDEDNIRQNCRAYKHAMENHFGEGNGVTAFASKALCFAYLYRIIKEEGLSADIVSGGELHTAVQAGFPTEKLYFHGNNKSPGELRMALEYQVGRIIVDNADELQLLNRIAGEMGCKPSILFRIKPGIEAHTHEAIMTGQIDSKFGVALENGEAETLIKQAFGLPNVEVVGLHCHIGSQIFENEPFVEAAKILIGFMDMLRQKTGHVLTELDLGGGFGIQYTQKDAPKTPEENIAATAEGLKAACASLAYPMPKVIIEPGRAIVGPAGITAYTVGSVKQIKGIRTYVSIDGGMADNPRYALYGSEYTVLSAERPLEAASLKCAIAGKCCESGDLIAKDTMLQQVKAGDVICVLATGAYNYSMSSHYNRLPVPPVIMASQGKTRLVVKRESYDDLMRNDIL